MLTNDEKNALEEYILKMQEYGLPLSMDQLHFKVAEMTQQRVTPFRDGILGNGWLKWFKKRHPNLTLRQSQGLEIARAKGLCAENIKSFYSNLSSLYDKEKYPPYRIWNCDETGAQAGRNGGGLVWAKKGTRSVHNLMPNEREWLTNLTCINAAGECILGFYIFRGKRIRENYLAHCEDGVVMAMQEQAWMTTTLFSHWISHFIRSLSNKGGISQERRHLLIVDGHNSHVTLEVVYKCKHVGLDLLTRPSHTSHRLQPLDVSVFGPFKRYFKRYRDAWTLKNRGRGACKKILAMWVSKALERALTHMNITSGFRTTGIYPLNPHIGPSQQFHKSQGVDQDRMDFTHCSTGQLGMSPCGNFHFDEAESQVSTDIESDFESQCTDRALQDIRGDLITDSQKQRRHFFVPPRGDQQNDVDDHLHQDDRGSCTKRTDPLPPNVSSLLELPEIVVKVPARRCGDPLIGYSQSLLLTS